jgi:crossover junction endodeoxyribonuclease RuvC
MGIDPVGGDRSPVEVGAGDDGRDAGVIATSPGQALEARLNAIYGAVARLIEVCHPGLLVVEDLYTEYRFRTAILGACARRDLLAARQASVPLLAISPAEVKRAVTGNGAASKHQVQRGVQTVLGLAEVPRPSHIADALGLAVTGLARATGRLPAGRAARGGAR